MDRDGLCDAIEAVTGTDALEADTDKDGVPDGVEDEDRDGVVDGDDTDPRTPGLFPGGDPHIPEPMIFDLVRALGAKRGEVEVNTLTVYDAHHAHDVHWAPEVEWAMFDGISLELELPMVNRELESLKVAAQVTLPPRSQHVVQGIQVIGDYHLSAKNTDLIALYILGGRLHKLSILALTGLRATTPMDDRTHYQVLLNPNLFFDLRENMTVGLENNLSFRLDGQVHVALTPQLHWQISRRVRLQVGAGVSIWGRSAEPLTAARLVLE